MSLVNSELLQILTNVASAYFRNWYCFVPSGMSLRGLNVRVLPLFMVMEKRAKIKIGALHSQAKERRHDGQIKELAKYLRRFAVIAARHRLGT